MTALVKFEYKFFSNFKKLTLTLSRPDVEIKGYVRNLDQKSSSIFETAFEAGTSEIV